MIKKIKTLTLKEGGKMRNETGAKVIKKNYCTQNKGDCLTCSLSSYHLDCRSQSICRANDGQAVTEVESIFGGFKMEKSPYQIDGIDALKYLSLELSIED